MNLLKIGKTYLEFLNRSLYELLKQTQIVRCVTDDAPVTVCGVIKIAYQSVQPVIAQWIQIADRNGRECNLFLFHYYFCAYLVTVNRSMYL